MGIRSILRQVLLQMLIKFSVNHFFRLFGYIIQKQPYLKKSTGTQGQIILHSLMLSSSVCTEFIFPRTIRGLKFTFPEKERSRYQFCGQSQSKMDLSALVCEGGIQHHWLGSCMGLKIQHFAFLFSVNQPHNTEHDP